MVLTHYKLKKLEDAELALFEGTDLTDEDQVNAVSSIMTHAVNNEQLRDRAEIEAVAAD